MPLQVDDELPPLGVEHESSGRAALFGMEVVGGLRVHDVIGPVGADVVRPIGTRVQPTDAVAQPLPEAAGTDVSRRGDRGDLGLEGLAHAANRLAAANTSWGVNCFMQA